MGGSAQAAWAVVRMPKDTFLATTNLASHNRIDHGKHAESSLTSLIPLRVLVQFLLEWRRRHKIPAPQCWEVEIGAPVETRASASTKDVAQDLPHRQGMLCTTHAVHVVDWGRVFSAAPLLSDGHDKQHCY